MSDYIKQQHEARQKAWHEAKALLDNAAAEKRDLSAEENVQYDKINADLDSRAQVIETLKADAEREVRAIEAMKGFENQARPMSDLAPSVDDNAILRSLARGEIRSHTFEKRDVVKTSTGSPVPTSFYDQVLLLARNSGPMLETSTILNTNGGENLQIPSIGTYSSGTIAGEGTAIGESDPVFNSFVTLSAYKYSFLTQVSRELVEDSGVDILGFLAGQVGQELGFSVNNALTVGTGGVEPNGVMARAAAGVTGGTGTSGVFTADNLIDLVYSVDSAARRLPGAGFLMNGASIGKTRKLKDTAGYYIFSPSLSAEARDILLGYPIYENPAVVDTATSAKSVAFGNLKSYLVRTVGGLKVDTSSDFAFNTDLITLRCIYRVDGNLVQTSHIKRFIGASS